MHTSTKWVATLALLTALPANGVAGPFGLFGGSKPSETQNQEIAEDIAKSLRAAELTGRDVEIEVYDGTATLTGIVGDANQKAKATQIVSHVDGVERVDNRMRIATLARELPQATATRPSPIRTASAEQPARPPFEFQQVAAARSTARPKVAPAPRTTSNQEIAQNIANAFSAANVRGSKIQIRVQNGTAELGGTVKTRQQWDLATGVARSVPGVERVNNRMRVATTGTQPSPVRNAVASQGGRRSPIVPVAHQPAPPAPGALDQPPATPIPAGPPAGFRPPLPPTPQSYGYPGAAAQQAAYTMPNMPDHAWPSYASYPNSAQISYPTQYSASAWPYIGPFYPYPQVPLGWREAQLEWDDGMWLLNFRPRTSKPFWFVNPRNW